MRFLTGKRLLVLTLAWSFAAPSAAWAQGGKQAVALPEFEPSPEVLQLHPNIWDYRFDAKQYRHLYATDLSSMAIGMYNLSGKQAERIRSLTQKMSSRPTKDENGYDSLLDRRAQHFERLINNAARTRSDLNDLILKDRTLEKYSEQIDAARSGEQLSFSKLQQIVESDIDPDSLSQARESWGNNLQKLGVKVSLYSVALEAAAAGGIEDEPYLKKLAKMRANRPQDVKMDAVDRGKSSGKPVERMKEVKGNTKGAVKPMAGKPPRSKKPAARSKSTAQEETANAKQAAKRSKRSSSVQRKTPKAKQAKSQQIPNAPPLSEWEQFVRDFIEEHKLSEAQTHSALGILEEQQSRARAVETRQANQRKRVEEIKDRRQKAKKLAELDRPIDRLFANLKARLDQLLTAQQRADARNKAGTSRKSSRKK